MAPNQQATYFSVSRLKLIVLSLCTFNLYQTYWFYKNWRIIKDTEQSNISPFWRAIFSPFFCYDLFKRVIQSAQSNGYEASYAPGTLAALYIILLIQIQFRSTVPPSLAPFLFLFMICSYLSVVPLLTVQRAINFNNAARNPADVPSEAFTGGEITTVIIGIFLTLPMVLLPILGMFIGYR